MATGRFLASVPGPDSLFDQFFRRDKQTALASYVSM
jgi:hypothetical protein